MNKNEIINSVDIEKESELVNILSEIAIDLVDETGIDGEYILVYLAPYLEKILPLVKQNSISKSLTYGDNH